MKVVSKFLQAGLVAVVALLLVPVSAFATTPPVTTTIVHGTFHTIAQTCPPPDDTEQCVIDALAGDLVGTNKLVTVDFVETSTRIIYEDTSYITTQYGTFAGTEIGEINKQTGAFHSVARLTSTDGCGSKLTNVNSGVIDLETLEDSGTYDGVLKLKSCN